MNTDSLTYMRDFMLACPYKERFGIDCPGCGMQRSAVALSQGEVVDSVLLYPALIPIIAMFILLGIHIKWKLPNGAYMLLALYLFNMIIVLINYLLKFI